jgi:hypothetical protein
MQKMITSFTIIGLFAGTYLFLAYEKPKTFFGEFLHEAVLTQSQLQKERDQAYERELEEAFAEDDF